jgi:hypothetical protein
MAWLHNNGDEDELAQFEDEEGGDPEPLLEAEGEEEIVVTERVGAPVAPPPPMPKTKGKGAPRSKPKARRAKPKAKAKKKPAKKRPAKKASGKRGKRR